jgi:hypothetical protein
MNNPTHPPDNFKILRKGSYNQEFTTRFFVNSVEETDLKKISRFLTNTTNEELYGIFSLGEGSMHLIFHRPCKQYVCISPESIIPYCRDKSAEDQLRYLITLARLVKKAFDDKYWEKEEEASTFVGVL